MRISRWYLTALWQEEICVGLSGFPQDLFPEIFLSADHEFQCYQGRFSGEQTPVAKYVADRVLTLPDVCDLAMEDVTGSAGC